MLRNEKVIRSLLSKEMLKDVKDYEKTGEDAIYWLANKKGKTYKEIITRFQSSEIDMVSNSGLKTEDEWKNLYHDFGEVNSGLVAVDDDEEKGKLYSCYAIKGTTNRTSKVMFPLMESYASRYDLFSNKNDCPNYNYMLNKISDAYNIKIKNSPKTNDVEYKESFKTLEKVKSAGYKVLNLCRKFLKKEKISEPISFRGKTEISTQKLADSEKLTGILNHLVEKTAKYLNKTQKLNLSERELYAASLYSDILMSRVLNYGDSELNEKIELSLRLQFSNLLARDCYGIETLNKIADLGMDCAMYNLKKLGINTKEAVANAKNAGYEFANEPTTLREAMLGHKVNVYKDELTDDESLGISDTKKKRKNTQKPKIAKKKPIESKKGKNTPKKAKEEQKEEDKEGPKKEEKPKAKKQSANPKQKGSKPKTKKESPKRPRKRNSTKNANPNDIKEEKPEEEKEPEIELIPEIEKQPRNQNPQKFETSIRKKVDKVVNKAFKNYMQKTVLSMGRIEKQDGKVYNKIKRRHSFVEDMLDFYENNKKIDTNGVVDNFRTLNADLSKEDKIIAKKYANALINLREAIVESIYEDRKLKDEYINATSADVVNKYIAERFEKGTLPSYLNNILIKSLKSIDNLSESTKEL